VCARGRPCTVPGSACCTASMVGSIGDVHIFAWCTS
jgi:hypothetical protein